MSEFKMTFKTSRPPAASMALKICFSFQKLIFMTEKTLCYLVHYIFILIVHFFSRQSSNSPNHTSCHNTQPFKINKILIEQRFLEDPKLLKTKTIQGLSLIFFSAELNIRIHIYAMYKFSFFQWKNIAFRLECFRNSRCFSC